MVSVKILGVREVGRFLNRATSSIESKTSDNIMEAANFVKDEVKASIAGQRAEKRSVDTGEFLNSIKQTRLSDTEAAVSTDVEHALFLEFGTSRIDERRHFRNTVARSKDKVIKILKDLGL